MAGFATNSHNWVVFAILFTSYCSNTSEAASIHSHSWCQRAPGFSSRQKKMCNKVPGLQTAIKKGLEMGISECERIFRKNRWNCTLLGEKSILRRAPEGTKEAAFTAALFSSALAYSVAKACKEKDVVECNCEPVKRPLSGENWNWRGCSDNIRYGSFLAEQFIVGGRSNRSRSNTMRKHNVRVGLDVLKENRLITCTLGKRAKLKSCHVALPTFRKISRLIKGKYYVATKVISVKRERRKSFFLRTTGRYRGRPNGKRPNKTSLVFLDRSPSYCYRQDKHNIPGTRGRQCRRNSDREDDCVLLCCGRGYKREAVVKNRFCHCKEGINKSCNCKVCTDVIIENRCL